MSMLVDLGVREQRLALELVSVLSGSLDLQDVLDRTHGLLADLVPSDHSALLVVRSEEVAPFEWAVADMPSAFFQDYGAVAPHDFVRNACAARPNEVLRDSEMMARREIERTYLYQYCRSIHMPLEHVMAVLLSTDPSWHGGLVLYRNRNVPFSDNERALLQLVSPFFANAVSNCRRFGDIARRGSLLEGLLGARGVEAIIFARPEREIARTTGAEAILSRWFSASERGARGFPSALSDKLAAVAMRIPSQSTWFRSGEAADLKVCFLPLVENGRTLWAMTLEEISHAEPVPADWLALLSSAQIKVAERVLRAWDNALIASDLSISEETVKKHLTAIFNKLGVSTRAHLIHLARRMR